jgi:GPH family glycoside/pentoside/hexuronide:cation symporter
VSETPRSNARARELAYASGSFAADASAPILSWLPYLYAPPADLAGATALLPTAAVGYLLLVGRFIDGFAEPIVGWASDRARTRFGRRLPFVLFGTPVLVAALLALFFPPFGAGHPVATGVWLAGMNTLFWCAFTAVIAPYLALLPEIAETTAERTRISTLMTAFTIAATIAGNVVLGRVVARFSGGGELLGIQFANGFEPQAIAIAAIVLFFFYLAIAFVRERPHPADGPPHLAFRAAVSESFRNPAFLPLVVPLAVFLIGVNVVITAVPYLGRAVLHATESEASLGPAAVYLSAGVSLPLLGRAVRRFGKKRCYAASLLGMSALLAVMPAIAIAPRPTVAYVALMIALGLPVGGLLVIGRVLITDVIDADFARTGLRREAMYFGMQGLMTKVSYGLGPLVATQLFTAFGNTAERPLGILLCGPVAGALGLLGWLAFRRYPLD